MDQSTGQAAPLDHDTRGGRVQTVRSRPSPPPDASRTVVGADHSPARTPASLDVTPGREAMRAAPAPAGRRPLGGVPTLHLGWLRHPWLPKAALPSPHLEMVVVVTCLKSGTFPARASACGQPRILWISEGSLWIDTWTSARGGRARPSLPSSVPPSRRPSRPTSADSPGSAGPGGAPAATRSPPASPSSGPATGGTAASSHRAWGPSSRCHPAG